MSLVIPSKQDERYEMLVLETTGTLCCSIAGKMTTGDVSIVCKHLFHVLTALPFIQHPVDASGKQWSTD